MDLLTPEAQRLDYFSSSSSASNTLAPPSPEAEPALLAVMADAQAAPRHRRGSISAAPLSQYAALGQLSYAPATQTTVVTTTTTTTTSFPPLILRAPKHLYDRDPKQYPLAASPTPAAIRDFTFDVNGKPACFREADDLEGSLQQVCSAQTAADNVNKRYHGSLCPNHTFDTDHLRHHPLPTLRLFKASAYWKHFADSMLFTVPAEVLLPTGKQRDATPHHKH
jgi:hypothetical protein